MERCKLRKIFDRDGMSCQKMLHGRYTRCIITGRYSKVLQRQVDDLQNNKVTAFFLAWQ
jgi:3-deoxy-D-manno-octulosonate 8-phosphate phosphatase KdsC-like HAD superfamily phosphatase